VLVELVLVELVLVEQEKNRILSSTERVESTWRCQHHPSGGCKKYKDVQ